MSSWSFSRTVAHTVREHGDVFRYCSLGVCCLRPMGLHAKQPATHFVSRPEWWLILLKVMDNKFICNRALLCVRPTLGAGKTVAYTGDQNKGNSCPQGAVKADAS